MPDFRQEPGPGLYKLTSDRYDDSQGVEFGADNDCSIKSNGSGATVTGPLFGTQIRVGGGHNVETLTGDLVLVSGDPVFQKLDPGGAGRDVDLPAEASSNGMMFRITNAADAAEDLTVKNDGGDTIVTVSQNEAVWVACDGTSWVHMGIETIALS